MARGVKIRVWGDFALFTRPEIKVERYSYDVMLSLIHISEPTRP